VVKNTFDSSSYLGVTHLNSVRGRHADAERLTRKRILLINIREEQPEDIAAIRRVNLESFGRPQEANLVEMLRTNGGILLSLVATYDGQVAGHILFSPVTAESSKKKIGGAGLAPHGGAPRIPTPGYRW
jgi:hypothetical protein